MVSRISRILALVSLGLVLFLSACSSSTGTGGSGSSTSSIRRISRELRSSSSVSSVAVSSMSSTGSVAFGSSSSRPRFFSLSSSSSPATAVPSGAIKIHVDADRGEAQLGDQVWYTITIKNIASVPLSGIQVIYSFSPLQLQAVDTSGTRQSASVEWMIDSLQPNEKRVMTAGMQILDGVTEGERVTGNAVAIIGAQLQQQTAVPEVRIIKHLPTTGIGDGTKPVEDTGRFLTPVK